MPRYLHALVLLSCLTAVTPLLANSSAATVRFGTTCAHCHEGECSGRLTFALLPEAAFDHIRQYAGPTDDALARQLYDTLAQMKSDCRYPPLAPPDLDRALTAHDLAPYLDPWAGDYFLPLGQLAPGRYGLAVAFDGGGRVRVELIDDEFDPLLDRCETLDDRRLTATMNLSGDRLYYLRLRPRGPLRVVSLALTRMD